MVKEARYRLNVGLIIVNNNGKLLLCKRKNSKNWQFPQGGINKDETERNASYRELFEEVGLKKSSVRLLAKSKKWYKYDIPKNKRKFNQISSNFKGQKQKWFLYKLIKNDAIDFSNDPDNEFDSYKWVSYWYPLSKIVFFKKDIYRRILNEFKEFIK